MIDLADFSDRIWPEIREERKLDPHALPTWADYQEFLKDNDAFEEGLLEWMGSNPREV